MRIRKGRVPTGDRIVEAKDWVGMGRTAAAGFWALRRACARAGRGCRGGRAGARAGRRGGGERRRRGASLVGAAWGFPGPGQADPVKGEATLSVAGGYGRL